MQIMIPDSCYSVQFVSSLLPRPAITGDHPIAEDFLGVLDDVHIDEKLLLAGVLRDKLEAELEILESFGAEIADGLLFVERLLDHEVERARRLERPVSLVMIDIDHFKRFNDTYGHQSGDEVLRHVAQLTAGALRRSDAVARYGGEEFVVLLPEATLQDALAVAEKIRTEVERGALGVGGVLRPLQVTVSLGVAAFPSDAINGPDLVAAADRALYEAKNGGRNRVCHVPADVRGG